MVENFVTYSYVIASSVKLANSVAGVQVYMGQLRNKCVLDVPASANWSSWVNNDRHWFIVEGNPELCGNASGAR